jgi:hypothetical protein
MTKIAFNDVLVECHHNETITRFPDGTCCFADHAEQPGQRETAQRIGYAFAEDMNRDHDMAHSLLAFFLGLPHSPTLKDVSENRPASEIHYIEEQAILSLQAYANAMGIDLFDVARMWSVECGHMQQRR